MLKQLHSRQLESNAIGSMIQPGATIGILGGGQLGRMSILAGRRMGYRFHVFEPLPNCPAGMVADSETNASYLDMEAIKAFGKSVDVVTMEFENVPAAAAEALAALCPVHPSPYVLATCQNRLREKTFLRDSGFPCAPFRVVRSAEELTAAVAELGYPCVLKTADFGYDGKGQYKLAQEEDFAALWDKLGYPVGVLEKWIHFTGEYSVLCARNASGEEAVFPLAENHHVNHILHTTICPARIAAAKAAEAEELARSIAEKLGLIGLLGVELFLAENGEWIVNELAPRPHNSGHHTLEACRTNQFEQHIRAVCGLPLGSTEVVAPAVMVNILGDAWSKGAPNWEAILSNPNAKLHLYDKGEPRRGRKMGHFTVLGDSVESALEEALILEAKLLRK